MIDVQRVMVIGLVQVGVTVGDGSTIRGLSRISTNKHQKLFCLSIECVCAHGNDTSVTLSFEGG